MQRPWIGSQQRPPQTYRATNMRAPKISRLIQRLIQTLIAVTVSFSVGCRSTSGLLNELKARESTEGLAVVCLMSSRFEIVSFSQGPYLLAKHPKASAWISESGDLVVWNVHTAPPGRCEGATSIETLNGDLVKRLPMRIVNPSTMGISSESHSLAFDGRSFAQDGSPSASDKLNRVSYLHFLNSGTVTTVSAESSVADSGTLGWSPSGRSLTYGSGKRIYVLDLSTGESTVIADGYNPTWSPDGRWITFRSTDGWAMAIDPVSMARKKLLPNKILGAVHWSPDSRYVFVTEPVGLVQIVLRWLPLYTAAEFVVYRIEDLARASVGLIPAEMSTEDLQFQWIKGLPGFIKGASMNPAITSCE